MEHLQRYFPTWLGTISRVLQEISNAPDLDKVKNLKDVMLLIRQGMASVEHAVSSRKVLGLLDIADAMITCGAYCIVGAAICTQIYFSDHKELLEMRKNDPNEKKAKNQTVKKA